MFCSNGLAILPDIAIGMKNTDLALIYTIFITTININKPHYFQISKSYEYLIIITILYLLISSFYSYFHYDLSIYQIIQASRSSYIIISYFFLRRLSLLTIHNTIILLQNITLISATIYILQIILGKTILPYPTQGTIDPATGLIRLYNFPILMTIFLLFSFLNPQPIKKNWITIYRAIFIIATLCTFGRTYIFTNIFILTIGILLQKGIKKFINKIIIIAIITLLLANSITTRLNETIEDISYILETKPEDLQYFTTGGTLTYRIAWYLERFYYLIKQPISEQIFGMGLISDSQPQIMKMYHFNVGSTGEIGNAALLTTPDISWGNLLTYWGFFGSIIILCLWLSIALEFYSKRKISPYATIGFISIIGYFILSLSSSILSNLNNLTIFFLLISYINYKKQKKII